MKIVFFTSLFLIVYTYALYPLILAALGCIPFLRKRRLVEEPKELPTISLLVSAYNEESVIDEKVRNCLGLDYPKEKLRIIFGTSGSTDRTAEIIRRYAGEGGNISLYDSKEREGKPSTVNKIVKFADGEILLFSDADTFLEKNVLKKVAQILADESIGCVCGNIALRCNEKVISEGVYWRYEMWLKEMESNLGSVIGVTGGLYALRRPLWKDIPANTLIDDLVIAMNVTEKGSRVIYDSSILASEKAGCSIGQEFTRRVRIGAGGFQSIFLLRGFLNPLKGLISWEFWSHKVIRWCAPFLFIAAYLTNISLLKEGPVFIAIFVLQSIFYLSGIMGAAMRDKGPRVFRAIQHFIIMNIALLVGFFYYVFGLQKVTWKKAKK